MYRALVLSLAIAGGAPLAAQSPAILQPGLPSNGRLDVGVPPDGRPLVVYQEASSIKALKCGNSNCSAGNTVTTVANLSVRRVRLAFGSDGMPVIGLSVVSSGLRVARCANAECSLASIAVVDPANLGGNTDHALVLPADGRPLFAYFDANNFDLKYARCADAACTSAQVVTLESAGSVGIAPSMSLIGGLPQIAYGGNSNSLRLARCASLDCSSGASISTLSAENVGDSAMIAGRDGFAMIVYRQDLATPDVLRLAKCNNAACTAPTLTSLDTNATGIGLGVGVQMRPGADGLPLVTYYDQSFQTIKLLRCTRPDCSAASSTTAHAPSSSIVTTTATAGLAVSVGGTPVLAYSQQGPGLTLQLCNTRSPVNAARAQSAPPVP